MKRRLISLIILMTAAVSALCAFAVTAYADGEDIVVSAALKSLPLPSANAYEQYEAQIVMEDGTENYTFENVNGSCPAGLDFTSDEFCKNGIVKGVPTVSGIYDGIIIKATNLAGESAYYNIIMRIFPKKIKVRVTAPAIIYDGKLHTAQVDCFDYLDENNENPLSLRPIVEYERGGHTFTSVKDVGMYYIYVQAPSGCMIMGAVEGDKVLTITEARVEIFVTNQDFGYDGETHGAKVTTNPANIEYAVKYRAEGQTDYTADEPCAVGKYDVRATITDLNYKSVTAVGIVNIREGAVNFSVTNNEHTYDGEKDYRATVTPMGSFTGDYSVVYRNTKTGEETAMPAIAGIYRIVVTLDDSENYILGGVVPNTLTISPKVYLIEGNSPAARGADMQIYKPINGVDVDGDENTVIVKNIALFSDPGMVVEDGITTETVQGELKAAEMPGLYTVTYSHDTDLGNIEMVRYVIVAGKIGDINEDGYLNGLDANLLDDTNRAPKNVTEARIWDVNKDGRVDFLDADAIRNRYRTPLVPYYPWIN